MNAKVIVAGPKSWSLWSMLQGYGAVVLGLIVLFNAPNVSPRLERFLVWNLESWVVALALALNLLVLGLVTHRVAERRLGVGLGIFLLALTPGSALATTFFAGAGGWLVLWAMLLVGLGEFLQVAFPHARVVASAA